MVSIALNVSNEFSCLTHVVLGRAQGYHRDPAQVEVVNGTQARTVAASGHPMAAAIGREFLAFQEVMERTGVAVHVPDLAPNSVQDQTCPRDIGFVIGSTFVTAGMRNKSRVEEIAGVRGLLGRCEGAFLEVPGGIVIEGGDVVVHESQVFVGIGQRSDAAGLDFLRQQIAGFEFTPMPCRPVTDGEDVLHLDCAFNPLGLGHALIYPAGLADIPAAVRDMNWIEVTRAEAAALATNVLSLAPDHVIARAGSDCARVNGLLRGAGYQVTEVPFDGVPSIGGSFRCATLPLQRL